MLRQATAGTALDQTCNALHIHGPAEAEANGNVSCPVLKPTLLDEWYNFLLTLLLIWLFHRHQEVCVYLLTFLQKFSIWNFHEILVTRTGKCFAASTQLCVCLKHLAAVAKMPAKYNYFTLRLKWGVCSVNGVSSILKWPLGYITILTQISVTERFILLKWCRSFHILNTIWFL